MTKLYGQDVGYNTSTTSKTTYGKDLNVNSNENI